MSRSRVVLVVAGAAAVGAALLTLISLDEGESTPTSDESLSFSRAGDALAFASDRARDGETTAVYAGSAGGAPRRITRSEQGEAFPAISPDGSRVVFTRSEPDTTATLGSRTTLYVVDVRRGGVRRLTNRDDWDPAWSPAGDTITFVRAQDDLGLVTSLYSISADGGAERLVLRHARDPAWSPDGARLAFVSESRERVAVLDRRTGRIETVVRAKSSVSGPAWSPDGKRIAFDDISGDARVDVGYALAAPRSTSSTPTAAGFDG